MKIKSLTIQGFRGFNKKETVEFDEKLTLISARNSYGKTSISEGLEWLFYGVTSKVAMADSKDEFKGSYRNLHLPENEKAYVEVVLTNGKANTTFYGELVNGDLIKKVADGKGVRDWPVATALDVAPKPFILQHALKNLLLVEPGKRFQGFAQLLGLDYLEKLQKNIVSLCTKPETRIPREVSAFLRDLNILQAKVSGQPSLIQIDKILKKTKVDIPKFFKSVFDECFKRIPKDTKQEDMIEELTKARDKAISKIFNEKLNLSEFSTTDQQVIENEETILLGFVSKQLIEKYLEVKALKVVEDLSELEKFYGLGIKLLEKLPEQCPFCKKTLHHDFSEHIGNEHGRISSELEQSKPLIDKQETVNKSLKELVSDLHKHAARHTNKISLLLNVESSLEKLKDLLVPKHQEHYDNIKNTITDLSGAKSAIDNAYADLVIRIAAVETSIKECTQSDETIKSLGVSLITYVAKTKDLRSAIGKHSLKIRNADQILKAELDIQAGTEDISILIELIQNQSRFERKFKIEYFTENLKELRKLVDQYVATQMLNAISKELNDHVMEWYKQIKTTGDPDVHFCGFDMEKTVGGDLKSRRVSIKAKSYGENLVSAVSSLSESKLNALGLCVSIATNLKDGSPFDFIIIDDPIQSWDEEHEIQFIEVIKKLIEKGKQVVVLSHNANWLKQVREGCCHLNGVYYEITGYAKDGPHIKELPFREREKRFQDILAIQNNPDADASQLQAAEQELRFILTDISSDIFLRKKGEKKRPHRLNADRIHKILLECNISEALASRVIQAFGTIDNAHHNNTSTHRERLRQYYSVARELENAGKNL